VIRVLLADDHAIVREGVRQALAADRGIEVVAEASTGPEALALAVQYRPDVVVMDISMPGESGLHTTARMRRDVPAARILMLTVHDHPEYVLECVRAGAQGYLRKDTLPAELRDAVRRIHAGESFFSAQVLSALGRGAGASDERPDIRHRRLDALTGRERDVLIGVAGGETNKEIASRLGLSPRTVESYRESLMRKLEIHTVAGLTRFAVETGLIQE
jgi:DNA-binding NarL/FixJ family response regulator